MNTVDLAHAVARGIENALYAVLWQYVAPLFIASLVVFAIIFARHRYAKMSMSTESLNNGFWSLGLLVVVVLVAVMAIQRYLI